MLAGSPAVGPGGHRRALLRVRVDAGTEEALIDPDPTTPLGLLGIGEVGIAGWRPRVANAVHHATVERVRELSIRLEELW
ncbi:hypothetical protein SAMN05443637_118144 [Pseudonocardia thermophila]|mgnify:CR=1 FL=1|jgi:Aerobic-type carbon monoxide dehydrogenase, large subunit CoxL/CutL homologs|uniref:Uncharacterized protein n=1 Tax=Pseudonocardia thermophila TaxID=1848 RepID=A0A1M6Y2B3_PSETH|nr:hypothetical protein [Pseudonocardia thermophila]SHL12304.1 hypothetical protein SAMN05443637_118144 [Pseudonocardia thermophila]